MTLTGLTLSRASLPDAPALISLHHAVIRGPLSDVLVGPDTPAGRAAATARWEAEMRADAADLWLKITDTATGQIVSAAQWKVYPTWVPVPRDELVRPAWFVEREGNLEAEDVLVQVLRGREEWQWGGPHVMLNRLYTHPEYQRRGCGKMLVDWGCRVADLLFVPAWVVATEVGVHLYGQCGFEEVLGPRPVGNERYDLPGTMMKRAAKVVVDGELVGEAR